MIEVGDNTMPAETLFAEALKIVESESIRNWATSDHNRPLWLDYCSKCTGTRRDPNAVAAYIVCLAIGM